MKPLRRSPASWRARQAWRRRPLLATVLALAFLASPLLVAAIDNQRAARIAGLEAAGVPATPDALDALESLFNSSSLQEEKFLLVRAIGSMRTDPATQPGLHQRVAGFLKQQMQADDLRISRTALLTYARRGYTPELVPLLHRFHRAGHISDDVMYGELAHVFHTAPEGAQQELLAQIGASRNAYAIDILTSGSKDPARLKALTPALKGQLRTLLLENQPSLSTAIGELGSDAIVYSDWLHVVALLSNSIDGTSYDSVVLAHLGSDTAPPKKLLAYFSSAEGQACIKRLGMKRFAPILARMRHFGEALPHPQNPYIKELLLLVESVAQAAPG